MKNIKTLLISINGTWRYSNYGVDQLAGYLRREDRNVDILYAHDGVKFDSVKSKLKLEYDIYGLSVNSANLVCCLKIVEFIKNENADNIIVLGGRYVSRYYREVLERTEFVDYIVLGDGEVPLNDIIRYVSEGRLVPSEHSNIVTRRSIEGKKPYFNHKIDYFPAFDYWEKDTLPRNTRKEYCIQSKNNVCTGSCSFCTECRGKIVYKPLDHVVEEIENVSKKFGVRKFFFTDDNLFDPNTHEAKERIEHLCRFLQKLNKKLIFKCYIKANTFTDSQEDLRLLRFLSEVGFKTMFVGIESGNENDLKLYNKFCTVEDNRRIVGVLKSNGIVPQIGFININPYSTLETLRANYDYLSSIEMDNLFMYVCSYLRVFKYTPIYNRMASDNLLLPCYDYLDDTSLYKFKDQDVARIFEFIYEHMYKRVRYLDFDFDWLYSYYNECKHINSEVASLENELLSIRKGHLQALREFFYHLFIEANIEYCLKNVDNFLSFFEQSQPKLQLIHSAIINYYMNAS